MKKCLICQGKFIKKYQDLFDDRYGSPGKYNIYECQNCNFARLDPTLNSNQVAKFYAKYYPLSGITSKQVRENVSPQISFKDWFLGTDNICHKYIKPQTRVLDIGSASGQSLIEIKLLKAQGFGIEPDPNAQKIARELKLKVYKGMLSASAYPKQKFDFVTASQVIEHEINPDKFLKIAKSKLTKNGQIILAFPNYNSVYLKIFGKKWINWHVPYHCNFFNKSNFQNLIQKNGLKITEYRTITPTVWTIQQIRNQMSRIQEGQKNPIWSVNSSADKKTKPRLSLFMEIMIAAISIFNRIIDQFGIGDSLIFFLEKND